MYYIIFLAAVVYLIQTALKLLNSYLNYKDSKKDNSDEPHIAQKACKICGKSYDIDYPHCPYCGK